MASNDHDVSEACWSDEIFPMSSMQLLHEIRKVGLDPAEVHRQVPARHRRVHVVCAAHHKRTILSEHNFHALRIPWNNGSVLTHLSIGGPLL